MPQGIGYGNNLVAQKPQDVGFSNPMSGIANLLRNLGHSSDGRSFFSPQFELLSAFNERDLDRQYGRPQRRPGALGNVPGFFSDLAAPFRTNPTAADFGGNFTLPDFSRSFPGDRGPQKRLESRTRLAGIDN